MIQQQLPNKSQKKKERQIHPLALGGQGRPESPLGIIDLDDFDVSELLKEAERPENTHTPNEPSTDVAPATAYSDWSAAAAVIENMKGGSTRERADILGPEQASPRMEDVVIEEIATITDWAEEHFWEVKEPSSHRPELLDEKLLKHE